MAVSKSTRPSTSDTNQILRKILQSNQVCSDREQTWSRALAHSGTGDPPLRFPVYECLYRINVHAHGLVDTLRTVSNRFSINQTWSVYQQSLVQYVRAAATRNIMDAMAEVEHTEAWLFQTLQHREEKKFRDPDDVYFEVRDREAERVKQGFPPRIRFVTEKAEAKSQSKPAKSKNSS
ncbi:MAG: hypothetical protein WA634_05490 [Silvibacterium sp.]